VTRLRVRWKSEVSSALATPGSAAGGQPVRRIASNRYVRECHFNEVRARIDSGSHLRPRHQGLRHSSTHNLGSFSTQQAFLFSDGHDVPQFAGPSNARMFPSSSRTDLGAALHVFILPISAV